MPHQRDRNAHRPPSTSPVTYNHRFAIRLSYNGSTYQGFQSQPYKNTIQDQIEHRLHNLLKRRVGIVAWGRTDAGVHAKGAVITVDLSREEVTRFSMGCDDASECEMKAAQFLLRVLKQFACGTGVSDREGRNRFGSISALSVTPVSLDFDARYSALWKRYVYFICSGEGDNSLPFAWMCHAWRVGYNLDLDLMKKAAELLSGKEHNYEWLSVVQEGELRDSRRTTYFTIEEVMLAATQSNLPYFLEHNKTVKLYKVTATSDFFLYKMMRRIVGMLVSIGRGHATLDSLAMCIEEHDNPCVSANIAIPKELVETAPPHGLCLDHVEYDISI
jgi:tRNA pseudouridine38-40 synthase